MVKLAYQFLGGIGKMSGGQISRCMAAVDLYFHPVASIDGTV